MLVVALCPIRSIWRLIRIITHAQEAARQQRRPGKGTHENPEGLEETEALQRELRALQQENKLAREQEAKSAVCPPSSLFPPLYPLYTDPVHTAPFEVDLLNRFHKSCAGKLPGCLHLSGMQASVQDASAEQPQNVSD